METKDPAPGTERVRIRTTEEIAKKWERNRSPNPAEAGVLRQLVTHPPSLPAIRLALAKLQDWSQRTDAALAGLAGNLDHIHNDLRAIREKLGIQREACGLDRPTPASPRPEKKRTHTPKARRRRR